MKIKSFSNHLASTELRLYNTEYKIVTEKQTTSKCKNLIFSWRIQSAAK